MLGEHPDGGTAAEFVEQITDAKSSADLSRRCFEGLLEMSSDEAGGYASKDAFEATLALVRTMPRDLSRAYLSK